MSLVVSPWLPAASRSDLETVMRRVTEDWLAEWIEGYVAIDVVTPARMDGKAGDWRGNAGRWLHVAEEDLVALGLAACAGRADRLNPVDRELLACVGDDMLADLMGRLGAEADAGQMRGLGVVAHGREGADGAKHRFGVAAEGQDWALLIALDETAVVRLRKAVAGTARTPALGSLSKALADETVRLGCHLGQTEITAAELFALAAGDVLVLDRRLDVPVPLTVDGNLPRKGKARIGADAAAIEVRLTEPIEVIQGN